MTSNVVDQANSSEDRDRAVPSSGMAGREAIVDMLIESAPQLVRQREFFASLDWRKTTAGHVERFVERMAQEGQPIPAGIARDILLAGHGLPLSVASQLAQELQALCRLNVMSRDNVDVSEVLELSKFVRSIRPMGEIAVALVRRFVELGAEEQACATALSCWPTTPRALHHVRQSFARHVNALPSLKVRVAGFSTTSTFVKALRPAFAKQGMQIEADEAPFGSAIAELHSANRESPGVFVFLDPLTMLEANWRDGFENVAANFSARLGALEQAIATYSTEVSKPLLINTLPAVTEPGMGHMDVYHVAGLAAFSRKTNDVLADLARRFSNVTLVDTDVSLRRISPELRQDARLWFYGRIAFSEPAMNEIADAFATAWATQQAKPVKVIALDFDNTLWGGVFGDDGIERLQCGDDPPGNAFKALQLECLRLKAQGKLLVALSKNNPDAIAAFEKHPGMALRADDFAATAINWQPKPDNIRRIAVDLNLGLDSFLFLDDSEHEREAMRRLCPEVRVPEMPADPALRISWLRGLVDTWPARLTAEDVERPAMYLAERKAREFKETAASYDDYLHGLEQRLVIEPLTMRTLPRVAQLHERTNQFNPTTQRYTEAELSTFMSRPVNSLVLLGSAEDRFGAHGIVVAAVARIEGTTAYLDSLVMSCRVIARQIETAFIGAVLNELCKKGVSEVIASYRATAKNGLVRELYPSHGFHPVDTTADEAQQWSWKVSDQALPESPHVAVEWRPG